MTFREYYYAITLVGAVRGKVTYSTVSNTFRVKRGTSRRKVYLDLYQAALSGVEDIGDDSWDRPPCVVFYQTKRNRRFWL